MNAVDADSSVDRNPGKYYFSLVRGGPFCRFREAIGLVPMGRLGLARRIAALVLVAWAPMVAGALVAGQVFGGRVADPLLRHFAVHVRLLVAVPLLIVAEAAMERKIPTLIRYFVTSGLVDDATAPRFQTALDSAARLRDSVLGTLFVLTVMGAVVASATTLSIHSDELSWAMANEAAGSLGFGGVWYILVARPIFAALLAIWAWRMVVLWTLVWRVSNLELRLVANHPDRAGGLGFLEGATVVYAPIVAATSLVLAAIWGHQVLYHGVHVDQIKPIAAVFVCGVVIVFNGPLLVLGRTLGAYRRRQRMAYGALLSRHGRLVHRKWIENEEVGACAILDSPELGPVADINSMYEAVARMRLAPIGKRSVLPIALAAALPLIPVFAIEVPIKELLQSLAGALL